MGVGIRLDRSRSPGNLRRSPEIELQPHFIFVRTEAGDRELDIPTDELPGQSRRFLALIDGRRMLAELDTVARPGELYPIISMLSARGYIEQRPEVEQVGWKFQRGDDNDPFAAAALTPEMFVQIRNRAIRILHEKLGDAAAPVITALGACSTPVELRVALRAWGDPLAALMGREAARAFTQSIGRNLVA